VLSGKDALQQTTIEVIVIAHEGIQTAAVHALVHTP